MDILKINDLSKTYEKFKLQSVNFSVEEGQIVGFIGRNGAGKTTTIKTMLNLVHPTSGSIECFGKPYLGNEGEIKNRIGYSTGAVNYYPRKKIKDIVNITKTFYSNWDDNAYREYLEFFELDEEKTLRSLSEGMKVKFNLLLALSHKAELLILDEPTSGLDPFSRDELVDIFVKLKNRGVAILFSTHITSDLEKCADKIVYIRNGQIVANETKADFQEKYSKDNESLENTIIRLEKEAKNG